MASQPDAQLRRTVPPRDGRSIQGEEAVGAYLRERLFAHGAAHDWDELLVHATGERLQPRHFVEQFVRA